MNASRKDKELHSDSLSKGVRAVLNGGHGIQNWQVIGNK